MSDSSPSAAAASASQTIVSDAPKHRRTDVTTHRVRSHFFILLTFFGLAALMWWPLPLHMATHVPGIPQWAYDESTFLWNIWAFKHAVIDGLSSPLHSDLIYYPLGIDLILYTYNFYHVLVSLPVALATNIPLASNLSLLMNTTLSGYGAWLLTRWLLRDRGDAFWAALVAGAVFAFGSNRSVYAALGHYDMVTTQWLPFYALLLLRAFDLRITGRARYAAAALAGLFFALTGLAEMILALFLGIFTLIVVLGWQTRCESAKPRAFVLQWRRWLLPLAITGVVAFVIWSPVLLPILSQFLSNDYSLKGWGEAIPLSTDLFGWLTPTALHPMFGTDVVAELRRVQLRSIEESVQGFRDINTVFLGWVTLALAIAGAILHRARARIWWLTALVFGIFTLGPFLQLNGEYQFNLDGVDATFPLPYALLHWLPIIKANRAPNRNSVMLMLALGVLAAFAVEWWLTKWRLRRVAAGAAGLPRWAVAIPLVVVAAILFEHAAMPMPLSDVRIPAVYAQIAADPRPVSVLNVPLGWRNSFGVLGAEATLLQYYQTEHGKPMLGGNTSRAPDFKMDYFSNIPWFKALTEIEFGRTVDDATLEAARAQGDEIAALYDVGYVILHPPVEGRPPYSDNWQAAWDFVRQTLPLEDTPFWAQDGIEAYRVLPPTAFTDPQLSINLTSADVRPLLGEGWDSSPDERGLWALADSEGSVVLAPLQQVDPETDYTVGIEVTTPSYASDVEQRVSLEVNGVDAGTQPVPSTQAEPQPVEWNVPAGLLHDGLNHLVLHWSEAISPREADSGNRLIGSTGVNLLIDADLNAFADGGYISLFDHTGAQMDASAGRKGINLTTIDPKTGYVLTKRGFDTTANEYESQALATAIAGMPEGTIALVASNGAAGAHLTQDAVDALGSLGIDLTLEDMAGNYLAAVGVKGSAPGAAAHVVDPNEAFLRLSLNRDRRQLAAQVSEITIAPSE